MALLVIHYIPEDAVGLNIPNPLLRSETAGNESKQPIKSF